MPVSRDRESRRDMKRDQPKPRETLFAFFDRQEARRVAAEVVESKGGIYISEEIVEYGVSGEIDVEIELLGSNQLSCVRYRDHFMSSPQEQEDFERVSLVLGRNIEGTDVRLNVSVQRVLRMRILSDVLRGGFLLDGRRIERLDLEIRYVPDERGSKKRRMCSVIYVSGYPYSSRHKRYGLLVRQLFIAITGFIPRYLYECMEESRSDIARREMILIGRRRIRR